MNNLADFKPDWISSPGQTINDILREKQIEKLELKERMGCSVSFIEGLISGKERINKDVASQLSHILGASKNFWLNREAQYREYLQVFDIVMQQKWVKSLPWSDMVKFGWVNKEKDKYQECLEFFNISSFEQWKTDFSELALGVNYRTSKAFKSTAGGLTTWLRQGEIQASKIECEVWNPKLFEETLYKIKPLTRIKNPRVFLPNLIKICAECGVAVSIVRNPAGCRASGATKLIANNKAMMLLSFRYLSDDHFWFTFFHEAGHLLLHDSNKTFIEPEKSSDLVNQEEDDANVFAGEILIPLKYREKLKITRSNKRRIVTLAQEAGVSPGIVIGQMQHFNIISHSYLNGYKRHYKWDDINAGLASL